MLKVKLIVTKREHADEEFMINLMSEVKSLIGCESVTPIGDSFECVVSASSSAHYVLKRWDERGMIEVR